MISLLDTPDSRIAEWYCVFLPREPYYRFTHLLKQGFRHIELTRPIPYGPGLSDVMWLNLFPNFEMLSADVDMDARPPWIKCPEATIVKVTAARKFLTVRSWCLIGPMSCVEIVKAALGIRAFWVRTPWQLYKYIRKRGGSIISR